MQEIDRQQAGGHQRPDRRRGKRDTVCQQEPHQHVEHGHGQGACQRGGHPPTELVISEELNPQPDQPVGEWGMPAAGQLLDPAGPWSERVKAPVLRVEDLVEDESDRSCQACKAKDRGAGGDRRQGQPVDEPAPFTTVARGR